MTDCGGMVFKGGKVEGYEGAGWQQEHVEAEDRGPCWLNMIGRLRNKHFEGKYLLRSILFFLIDYITTMMDLFSFLHMSPTTFPVRLEVLKGGGEAEHTMHGN